MAKINIFKSKRTQILNHKKSNHLTQENQVKNRYELEVFKTELI